ncbi:hypothetical protein [Marinilabilia salmonicolor]|uniref:hypothetical protein n=1 Tax=Marinilabilia salmonicolor TaxID=989 RepID=UPI00029A8FCD|nr:hypothetical protein [Marinilabilia salmonicolor]
MKQRILLKRLWKLLIISTFLMAFQCEDENQEILKYNDYKVNISPASSFSLNDTIWIKGIISSQVYNLSLNDSVFLESPNGDYFSIYKIFEPDGTSNCIDAMNKFKLILDKGDYSLGRCKNADLYMSPVLEKDNLLYTYRIGLKPLLIGDYAISWRNATIQNANRHKNVINNYPIQNSPNLLGFNSCGEISWRFLDESEGEYYFRVE